MGWPEDTHPLVEIEVNSALDASSPARFVTWIPWDSGFRGSGLRVGDLIVGHDDIVYDQAAVDASIRISDSRFGQWLGKKQLKPDDTLTLAVLRDDEPLSITGKIGGYRTYKNAEGKRHYGEGGPIESDNDGLGPSWYSWYRDFVDVAKQGLAGWDYYSGSYTKNLSERMQPFAERVAFLGQKYPSEFSRAVIEDYEAMKIIVAGEKRELTPADLAYRSLGESRATDITATADRVFAAYLAECESQLMKSPPSSPDSFKEDTTHLVGKLIRLPELSKRETLFETNRSWYWSGSGSGGYLIDKAAERLSPLYTAMGEYIEKVDPNFKDSIVAFIGIVEPEPALVCDVYRRITVSGLRVTPSAALMTNANDRSKRFFVDIRPGKSTEAFAGEAALEAGIRRPKLADDDTPQRVLEVAVEALKVGDMETWLACYATWHIRQHYDKDGSFVWVDAAWEVMNRTRCHSDWDRARQRLLDDVYGIEVDKVGQPYVVFDAARLPAGHGPAESEPRLAEEVKLRVNHIGRFGEEYRTFSGFMLHRHWVMQRLNGGPWRIAIDQAI